MHLNNRETNCNLADVSYFDCPKRPGIPSVSQDKVIISALERLELHIQELEKYPEQNTCSISTFTKHWEFFENSSELDKELAETEARCNALERQIKYTHGVIKNAYNASEEELPPITKNFNIRHEEDDNNNNNNVEPLKECKTRNVFSLPSNFNCEKLPVHNFNYHNIDKVFPTTSAPTTFVATNEELPTHFGGGDNDANYGENFYGAAFDPTLNRTLLIANPSFLSPAVSLKPPSRLDNWSYFNLTNNASRHTEKHLKSSARAPKNENRSLEKTDSRELRGASCSNKSSRKVLQKNDNTVAVKSSSKSVSKVVATQSRSKPNLKVPDVGEKSDRLVQKRDVDHSRLNKRVKKSRKKSTQYKCADHQHFYLKKADIPFAQTQETSRDDDELRHVSTIVAGETEVRILARVSTSKIKVSHVPVEIFVSSNK